MDWWKLKIKNKNKSHWERERAPWRRGLDPDQALGSIPRIHTEVTLRPEGSSWIHWDYSKGLRSSPVPLSIRPSSSISIKFNSIYKSITSFHLRAWSPRTLPPDLNRHPWRSESQAIFLQSSPYPSQAHHLKPRSWPYLLISRWNLSNHFIITINPVIMNLIQTFKPSIGLLNSLETLQTYSQWPRL